MIDPELYARAAADQGAVEPDLPPAAAGIGLVLIGHCADWEPRWVRRNVLCIDTGACAPDGHLTIAEIQGGELRLHRFPGPPAGRRPCTAQPD